MADNFLERFRARKNVSMEVDVPFDFQGESITFRIARFSDAESAGPDSKALEAALSISDVDARRSVYGIAYAREKFLVLRRHVKGWTHTPKAGQEALPFTAQNLTEVLSCMGFNDQQELVRLYDIALSKDEEEAKKKGLIG